MIFLFALALSLADVKTHYAGTKGLEADIEQTKTSPYLTKPLLSKIHLAVKPGEIRWEVKEPVASTFVFDESGKSPFPENDKTKALIGFIKSLVTVDFPAIEREFTLEASGQKLIATPRAGSPLAGMIKRMELGFAPDLTLSTLDIDAANEATHLVFRSLTLVKK
jgi:hypothetical protein